MTTPIEPIAEAASAERAGDIEQSLSQLIVEAIEGSLAEMHTGLPGKIVSFDAAKGSCEVQPLLQRVLLDEDERPTLVTIPVLKNVPILYPAGGGWSFTWPLAVGNIVFLTFAERSIDDWLLAQPGTLVTPAQSRKHHLSDAICIPALRPRTQPIPNIDTTNLRIQNDAGTVRIELTPDTARVKAPNVVLDSGGAADQAIPRGDQLIAAIQAITVPTAFGPSGPPLNAGVFPSTLSATAKVK